MKCVRNRFLEVCAVTILLFRQNLVLNWCMSTPTFVDEESNWRGFLSFKRPEKETKSTDKIFQGKTGDKKQGNNGIRMSEESGKRYCKKLELASLASLFFLTN